MIGESSEPAQREVILMNRGESSLVRPEAMADSARHNKLKPPPPPNVLEYLTPRTSQQNFAATATP